MKHWFVVEVGDLRSLFKHNNSPILDPIHHNHYSCFLPGMSHVVVAYTPNWFVLGDDLDKCVFIVSNLNYHAMISKG